LPKQDRFIGRAIPCTPELRGAPAKENGHQDRKRPLNLGPFTNVLESFEWHEASLIEMDDRSALELAAIIRSEVAG